MPKAKKKLLPAPKGNPPEEFDRYVYSGSLRLYQLGVRCEAWKVTKRKAEFLGVGWQTSKGRWGIFCTRVEPPELVCVAKDLDSALALFDVAYG